MRIALLATAASVALITTPASAQSSNNDAREKIGDILGGILGIGNSSDNEMERQWRFGRMPLADQKAQFDARVDSDIQANRITQATGTRLKADYAALVDQEAEYGADRRFSTAERSALSTRYAELSQILTNGRYPDTAVTPPAEVADGQADFDRRVDAQLSKREISRRTARSLKADYAALIRVESGYLADGTLSDTERRDLDNRLDALDVRVGDVSFAAPATPKTRLDAIARRLPSSSLSTAMRAQLMVELGDLVRLESAYSRMTPTSEEQAYLEQRVADLEKRVGIAR